MAAVEWRSGGVKAMLKCFHLGFDLRLAELGVLLLRGCPLWLRSIKTCLCIRTPKEFLSFGR